MGAAGQEEAWVYNANAIFSLLLVQLFGEQHDSTVGYFSQQQFHLLTFRVKCRSDEINWHVQSGEQRMTVAAQLSGV